MCQNERANLRFPNGGNGPRLNTDAAVVPSLARFLRPFASFFQRFAGFQKTLEAGENVWPSARHGFDEFRAFFLDFVNDRELDRLSFLF